MRLEVRTAQFSANFTREKNRSCEIARIARLTENSFFARKGVLCKQFLAFIENLSDQSLINAIL